VRRSIASTIEIADYSGEFSMRPLLCALLSSICLLFQSNPGAELFLIPQNMKFTFPGVNLSPSEAKLLEKAVSADLAGQDACDKKKLSFAQLATAKLSLGKLGDGIIVKADDTCLCGTGGCPIFVYIREEDRYRTVAESFGWAFGAVTTKSEVPDLAFASNEGGGRLSLILQRYEGGGRLSLILQRYEGRKFVDHACETLISKKDFPPTPEDWFNPAFVEVRACENLSH
jgi:hypothetical protein